MSVFIIELSFFYISKQISKIKNTYLNVKITIQPKKIYPTNIHLRRLKVSYWRNFHVSHACWHFVFFNYVRWDHGRTTIAKQVLLNVVIHKSHGQVFFSTPTCHLSLSSLSGLANKIKGKKGRGREQLSYRRLEVNNDNFLINIK